MWAGDVDFVNIDGYIFDVNKITYCCKVGTENRIYFGRDDYLPLKDTSQVVKLQKLLKERGHKV